MLRFSIVIREHGNELSNSIKEGNYLLAEKLLTLKKSTCIIKKFNVREKGES